MHRRTYLSTLGALLALTAGCTEESMSGEKVGEGGSEDVYRFIDREAGVVIYTSHGYKSGGVSVIPISDTNLE